MEFGVYGIPETILIDNNLITDLTGKILGADTLKDLIFKNGISEAKKFAKANPGADVAKRFFTFWYYSNAGNTVSYSELGEQGKYEVTDECQLFQYEATFGNNTNESIGTSNVPDNYATDIYVWGFSVQYDLILLNMDTMIHMIFVFNFLIWIPENHGYLIDIMYVFF